LEIKGKELSGTLNKFHLREYYSNIDANLYCLTAIIHQEIESLGTLTLDIANTKFGSHFLIIKNPKLFYERIRNGFEMEGMNVDSGLVVYYDRYDINGEVSPFHKRNEFKFQKEFRFVIENQTKSPIKIKIGSLNEIAQIFEIKDLETLNYNLIRSH